MSRILLQLSRIIDRVDYSIIFISMALYFDGSLVVFWSFSGLDFN